MVHRDPPQPAAREESAVAQDGLVLEPGERPQLPLVEELRGERADGGMEPPRGSEEDAALRRNGLVRAKHLLKCALLRPRRVRPLDGL